MSPSSWVIDLNRGHSSYLILATLSALGATIGVLFWVGFMGWLLRILGVVVRKGVRNGFLLWEYLLSWASWPLYLAVVVGVLVVGGVAGDLIPGLRILCGLIPLVMGITACLAYMFIDLERYEVERGYLAVHSPVRGQGLAVNLARHGHRVGMPLMAASAISIIGGFAMLNQGLYETIGKNWFRVEGGEEGPIYADFLAYALINLLGIVDVLDLAQSQQFLRTAYVRQVQWPASALLTGFKSFFVMVLLQQIFASFRQGTLLAETIADFWSPHEPIHDRARNALPNYGVLAIDPLLRSLRSVESLTKEQRDQLPLIVATIGPSTIPVLVRHLHDPHEHIRALAVAALGHLRAVDTVPLLVTLGGDRSDLVRQCLVEALGSLSAGNSLSEARHPKRKSAWVRTSVLRMLGWVRFRFGYRLSAFDLQSNPLDLAVTALELALSDNSAGVRTQAARSLGQIGMPASTTAPKLISLLKDADETVRCQAAEALAQVGGEGQTTVAALIELLQDASAPVKAAAARTLGTLKAEAVSAVTWLVPLLQDRDEAVRTAAAEAIARVGPLSTSDTDTLVEGLSSPDTVVRAQTAQALGTIGAAAEDAAPALVQAMTDGNDRVRAKAAEALGKIGETAAAAAVPCLVRALRDQDNWVSALAAEALGQMGEAADGAIPALVRSLQHLNPLVRSNAAEALGRMGVAAAHAVPALEKAARNDDAGVRGQALRALGLICRSAANADAEVEHRICALLRAGFQDTDPLVRAAAVEAVGQGSERNKETVSGLLLLLLDPNDQVKIEVTRVLPRLEGATPAVIEGLCLRLLEDDSAWVQIHAALALGKLGPAAAAAGEALLYAIQTGEESVREQAMRAIAMIQPPETLKAFLAGLQDASGDIRKVASGGWMNAASIPEEVIPLLVVCLRDPEAQVRANAAHALARLDSLPAEAVPLLIACTADPSDAVRLNAATALKLAAPQAAEETMCHLIGDTNLRIRLIAASNLLLTDSTNATAGAVLTDALVDPVVRIRQAALHVVESLGTGAAVFLDVLTTRHEEEEDAELRPVLARILDRCKNDEKIEGNAVQITRSDQEQPLLLPSERV